MNVKSAGRRFQGRGGKRMQARLGSAQESGTRCAI